MLIEQDKKDDQEKSIDRHQQIDQEIFEGRWNNSHVSLVLNLSKFPLHEKNEINPKSVINTPYEGHENLSH